MLSSSSKDKKSLKPFILQSDKVTNVMANDTVQIERGNSKVLATLQSKWCYEMVFLVKKIRCSSNFILDFLLNCTLANISLNCNSGNSGRLQMVES